MMMNNKSQNMVALRKKQRAQQILKKRTIKFGDSSQRQSTRLPGTLAQLKNQVRTLFGNTNNFELWLDAGASGRAPGRGRLLIANESDYARIIDGDVIVMVLNGREFSGNEFLDAVKTTMQADFPVLPYSKEEKAKRFQTRTGLINTKAKWYGESSHRLDFVVPPKDFNGRGIRSKLAEPREARPESFTGGAAFQGVSTYQGDYGIHPFCQEKCVRKQHSTREPSRKKNPTTNLSSYSLDYHGKHGQFVPTKPYCPQDTRRIEHNTNQEVSTDISCYQAEFIQHPVTAYTKISKKQERAPSKPFRGVSSYQEDFAPKPFVGKTVFIEPQLSSSSSS